MSARRRPTPFLPLLLVSVFSCAEQEARYTRAEDEAAMAVIQSRWEAGGGGLVLSLCEDVAASDGWTGPGCQVEHLVKGGGRSLEHSEGHPLVGCGGCPFGVEAWVAGTAEGGPLTAPAPVHGIVKLQSGSDDDPYAMPWGVSLECDVPDACAIEGTVRADGTFDGTIAAPATATPVAVTLTRAADASCP